MMLAKNGNAAASRRARAARFAAFMFLLMACALAGCPKKKQAAPDKVEKQGVKISFGVGLSSNPDELKREFTPLMDYLNSHIDGYVFSLKIVDYDASKSLYDNRADVALLGAFQYAMMNKDPRFNVLVTHVNEPGKGGSHTQQAIIIGSARKGVRKLADVKGMTFGFSSDTSTTGYLLPMYYLATHGIDINRDIKRVALNEHDIALQSVMEGDTAQVAGVRDVVLNRYMADPSYPTLKDDIVVLARTDAIPNGPIVARADLGAKFINDLTNTLVGMAGNPDGVKALAAFSSYEFVKVTPAEYEPIVEINNTLTAAGAAGGQNKTPAPK